MDLMKGGGIVANCKYCHDDLVKILLSHNIVFSKIHTLAYLYAIREGDIPVSVINADSR